MVLKLNGFSVAVDFEKGEISSLVIAGKERLAGSEPLFRFRLRDRDGQMVELTALDAANCKQTEDGAIYSGFPLPVSVRVWLCDEKGDAAWRIGITPESDGYFAEWVEFPVVSLPHLVENNNQGAGGKVLFPYNEGVLLSDLTLREETYFRFRGAEYPSQGLYAVFPNMICSQMLAYIWEDAGFYMGAHDPERGVKEVNLYPTDDGVALRFKLFCGVDFGQAFEMEYPVVFSATEGCWESAAERYRAWFEGCLPANVHKIAGSCLPGWYYDSPLVLTYPVRGLHDMDEMTPNKLYPYTNGLPVVQEIKEKTDSRLLVLLMHWEGTAPWAPPYVWPPYGDAENFTAFKDRLHENGDMLGVYCSGFGYTLQSNLVDSYNKKEEYEGAALWRGMCAAPDGEVKISKICTGQRSGYDICPASPVGRALVNAAYRQLLLSGLDYAQILDQNHGGGQYFCYSRDHGHPPAPGSWMTEQMQMLLGGWNELAPNMLLGCESAAAEPFVGSLRFSDNRFELNYHMGVPVPLYSYIYHEYLRNFMGNQVSCPLAEEEDENLLYRLAYSFSIGDSMTLVLDQDGQIRSRWGGLKTDHVADKEKVLRLVKNLTAFYREQAKNYLCNGRMLRPKAVQCEEIVFERTDKPRSVRLPGILTTAWEGSDGSRGQILVNPQDQETTCIVDGAVYTVPALSAVLLPLDEDSQRTPQR